MFALVCGCKIIRRLILLAVAFSSSSLALGEGVFERDYFGAHVHRSVQNSLWKNVGFGAIRLHDANVTWADLEPIKGDWHWARLDKIIENARDADVQIMLPLQSPPSWAASDSNSVGAYGAGANTPPARIEDWDKYVENVVFRYKGLINSYEIWNEPNLKQFFNGTPKEMAYLTKRAYEIIRKIDPAAKVVCSGITGDYGVDWLRKYLAAGAGEYCDVIAYHLYTRHQPPENFLPIIKAVKNIINEAGYGMKPLWNTESGWLISTGGVVDFKSSGFAPDSKVLSLNEATSYIPRALLLARFFGVSRFYWYSWDHPSMGISTERGTAWNRAARLYSNFVALVSESKIKVCKNIGTIWNCQLQLKNGEELFVFWSELGERSIRSPKAGVILGINEIGEIKKLHPIALGEVMKISPEPIFIKVNQ